jgi:hypothetical protein
VLDHGVAEHEIEGRGAEGQARRVALDEGGVGDAFLRGQARARAAEARLEVQAHREGRLLRQRERGPAASAAGVEDAAVRAHPARSRAWSTFALRRYSNTA